jgi:hypothetical protein
MIHRDINCRSVAIGSSTRIWIVVLLVAGVIWGCAERPNTPVAKPSPTKPTIGNSTEAVDSVQTTDSLAKVPSLDEAHFHAFLAPMLDRQDPKLDGWTSEVIAEDVLERLELLGKKLASPIALTNTELSSFAVDSFSAMPLRKSASPVLDDTSLVITRAVKTSSPDSVDMSLVEVLSELIQPLGNAKNIRVKFKVFRIDSPDNQRVATSVYYQASGELPAGFAQQNATWHCLWDISKQPIRLAILRIDDYEEIVPKTTGRLRFTDVTQSALGQTDSFRRQLTRGVDYWRGRLESNYGVDPNGNQGLAVGDVNGDGLDDVFVCQQGGLPNRLYVHNNDGTLRDVSAAAGVDWMEVCRSALFVDLDNDGDQDLVMAQGWYAMIMTNDGTGKFTVLKQVRSFANLFSTTAADFDNDGDLDLFFCGRNPGREKNQSEGILGTPIPYHDANNAGPNLFWRNDGAGQFTDVTVETGLDVNNRRYSYAASWEDFDTDGDMDLYVANDFGRNNLYRNQLAETGKPHFEDVAEHLFLS